MRSWQWLFLVLSVLIAIQVRFALQPGPLLTTIIQTTPANFKADLLLEKQPVVIEQVSDLRNIPGMMVVHTAFGHEHTAKRRVECAYVACSGPANVSIVHPHYDGLNARSTELTGPYIDVKLTEGQALLLPFWWTFKSDREIRVTRYYDYAHTLARWTRCAIQ